MTSATSSRALAAASASLVSDHDVAGTLAALLRGCIDSLDAVCGGIMVADGAGHLELLASSSHEPSEIALYEAEHELGPSAAVQLTGKHAVVTQDELPLWPELAHHMASAAVGSALATPLRWDESVLGAMTIFRRDEAGFTSEDKAVSQAFADMAVLVIIHTDRVSIRSAAQRVEEALSSRIVIEQAKGVLANDLTISMAEAFEELRDMALRRGVTLTETARAVIDR